MTSDIKILHIESDFLICIKPFGRISEDGAPEKSIVPLLKEYTVNFDGNADIYPVHRLDRETGGLMVFARRAEAAAHLSACIQNGSFHKTYLAQIAGAIEPENGKMEDLLFHDRSKNKSYVVKRERKGVRRAALTYETLSKEENSSVVRVDLLTGRTHQIRVQFSSRGHSVLGDGKYGGVKDSYMHLWSYRLSFPDRNGNTVSFEEAAPFFRPEK